MLNKLFIKKDCTEISRNFHPTHELVTTKGNKIMNVIEKFPSFNTLTIISIILLIKISN